MVPVVEETVEKKVPVVIIDSGLDKPELFVKYVATNNYNGGKLAAEHLLATLTKQGKAAPRVMLFPYQPGSESTEQREKGFADRIRAEIAKQKAAGKPPIELIEHNIYAGATVDTAQKAAGPLLLRAVKEKVDGIFAVNESATAGLLNAMRSQGLNQKIALMGFDTSDPLLAAVEEGDVIGLIAQDPYRMGYLGVWVLVRHLEGDDVSAGGKDLSTGEYVITKANLKDTATRERFDPTLQAKRTIQTPEFKKK
jgi:ribose transport system substrate-binding protein